MNIEKSFILKWYIVLYFYNFYRVVVKILTEDILSLTNRGTL